MNVKRTFLLVGTTLCFSLPVFAATAHGKVVGTDKSPIAGATVIIMSTDYKEVTKAQSGADGTWTAEVPDPKGPPSDLNVGTMDETTKAALKKLLGIVVIFAPGKAFTQGTVQSDRLLETELSPAVSVGGTVQDGNGKPVEGAIVRLQGFGSTAKNSVYFYSKLETTVADLITTKTDATGHWKLDGVPQGTQVRVKLADDRFGQAAVEVEAGSLNATLKALPGATIKGRVLLPDGKPAVGFRVSGNGIADFTTDAEGRFAFTGLTPGRPWYQISDPKDEWLVAQKQIENLDAGETRDVGDLAAAKGVLVKGKLVDEEGKPVAGASVDGDGIGGISKADGSFEFHALPGQAYLWIQKEGFLSLDDGERQVEIATGDAPQTLAPITLKRGVYLTGTALDTNGKPAVGATIIGGARYVDQAPEATVDEAGNFKLGPLAPGKAITLQSADEWGFTKEEKLTTPSLRMAATTPKLKLTLQKIKPIAVTGRVVSPEGKPVAGVNFRITVFLDSTLNVRQYREVASNDQGVISITGLRPEQTPQVEKILSDGFVLVTAPKPTRTGDTWSLGNIVTTALDGEIKGVVLDGAGAPLAGVKVAIVSDFIPKIITTGTDGRFSLDKLPRGEVTLLAAKDRGFTSQKVMTGQDVQIRLENRPAPTQTDGVKLLQSKAGGHSGYIIATAVPIVSPDAVMSIIKRNGTTADPTAMAVVLAAFARRAPEIAANWGVTQWQQIKNAGISTSIAFGTGAALARNVFPFNPQFTASWFTEERAKVPANDFSADAADKYFSLAGVAFLLKRPDAQNLVDLGLTAADHSVLGDTRDEKLGSWGEMLAASPDLLERLTQEMEPMQRLQVWAGAVRGLSRTDTDAAAKMLADMVKMRQAPEIQATDAKNLAARETDHIWHATSADTLNEARQSLIAALSAKPGSAALQMAQQLSDDYLKSPALLYVARHHLAAGRTEDALAALKAMPDNDADDLAGAAALALPLDKALAAQLFQQAAKHFSGDSERYGGDYRPSGAIYDLYHALVDPADSRVRLEAEWSWRQQKLSDKGNGNNNESGMRSIAIAMGAIDLPRAQEMLAQIKTEPQQNEFAVTYIGLYLATNGQSNPLNPWQDNQF